MKLPRILDPAEIRVLGALLEKQQATPDYYPLTLNALVAACNQKSNRDPVMDLSNNDVSDALERLHELVLVWPVSGARSDKWRHSLDRMWELEPGSKAVMTLLLLRGPQTPGELRARSDRLHPFKSTGEVESALDQLCDQTEPLVVRLNRAPGQKEARWCHLAGGTPAEEPAAAMTSSPQPNRGPALSERIDELEQRIENLESELQRLREIFE